MLSCTNHTLLVYEGEGHRQAHLQPLRNTRCHHAHCCLVQHGICLMSRDKLRPDYYTTALSLHIAWQIYLSLLAEMSC